MLDVKGNKKCYSNTLKFFPYLLYNQVFFQVLNLFLALLLNAFDNGDDDEEEDDENEQDGGNEEPAFKRLLKKLTQTKKTAVFPLSSSPYREEIFSSSQEIQTMERKSDSKISRKSASGKEHLSVGKFAV